jgi:hypothetical protein
VAIEFGVGDRRAGWRELDHQRHYEIGDDVRGAPGDGKRGDNNDEVGGLIRAGTKLQLGFALLSERDWDQEQNQDQRQRTGVSVPHGLAGFARRTAEGGCPHLGVCLHKVILARHPKLLRDS